MVDHRILNCGDKQIWIGIINCPYNWFYGIYTKSPTFNKAFFSHFGKFWHRSFFSDVKMFFPVTKISIVIWRKIMDKSIIDTFYTKTLQTIFYRSSNPCCCIIITIIKRRRIYPLRFRNVFSGSKQSSHFC